MIIIELNTLLENFYDKNYFYSKMANITFDNLSKADGSALIDQNNTIIQATVFGPVDVPQSKINYEEAIVEILYKPKVSIPSTIPAFDYVREVENLLRNVFQEVIMTRLHPRTCISILIQEIYNGGSLLSSSINAVCCALIDAGVPMSGPVAGVTINLNDDQDQHMCRYDFVFDHSLNLITILTRGNANEENLEKAISMGQEQAKSYFNTIREKVKERFI